MLLLAAVRWEGGDAAKAREEYCCEEPRLQGSFESIFFEFTSCYCKIFSITSLNFGFSPS